MDDNFLYTTRPPVRMAFQAKLAQRLAALDAPGHSPRRSPLPIGRPLHLARLALLSLLVFAALGVLASAPVRAKALAWVHTVAGFSVEERAESPLDPSAASLPAPAVTEYATNGTVKAVPAQSMVVEVPTVTLPEALQNPPFPFSLPAWTPEGFTLDPNVGVSPSGSWVMVQWTDSTQREIALLVEPAAPGYSLPVGEDSSQAIEVNGQPALLVQGFWDSQYQWDPTRGISLDWMMGANHYRLIYSQLGGLYNEIQPISGDMKEIIRQLVRMAESVE
jgi:hypothetical protein